MASRRMFSINIINSAKFLKMPVSSQLLYFHLGLHADDDGVVEAYSILRMAGLSEDDLKILIAKNFVIVLNDDLVAFITDWHEHNCIRADRKVDSIYKDLLMRIVPNVEITEKKERSDLKRITGQPTDSPRTDNGQAMDGIGKDRLGKESKEIHSVRFDEFWAAYPKKTDKKKAQTAWKKIKPAEIDKIITDVIQRSRSNDWTKENGKYIPHPTTYINGERWNDEPEVKTKVFKRETIS